MLTSHEVVCREFLISSRSEECLKVQEEIIDLMNAESYDQRDCFAVRLVVEEALANAIKHGNAGDASKQVHVVFQVDEEGVSIAVADEGDGFCVEDVPDPTLPENLNRPCGRGLLLMRSFMTAVKYNDRGNVVTMRRCRTKADFE